MNKKNVLALTLVTMMAWVGKPAMAASGTNAFDPVEYAMPLMGTQSSFELSTGNTYPAIARPWGMNFWTPSRQEKWETDGSIPIRQIKSAGSSKPTNPVPGSMITDSLLLYIGRCSRVRPG